jgi:hypothetical protein
MTISNDKGKKTPKGVKKLSVKKETVKDLDAGPGKAKELGDDQLDAVNGGHVVAAGRVFFTLNRSNVCRGQ